MDESKTILLIDDSQQDLSLMKHALNAAQFKASLQVVGNGHEALKYLNGDGVYIDR